MVGQKGEPLNDPRYVNMLATFNIMNEGGQTEVKIIPYHKCTEEDLA